MMSFSGRLITQDRGLLTLEDTALALSRIQRFGGHARIYPWTVLQHSLLVRDILWGNPELTLLKALLHDSHEAITGDIPRPLKTVDMKELQQNYDSRLWKMLGGEKYTPDLSDKMVHWADDISCMAEGYLCGPPGLMYEDWCRPSRWSPVCTPEAVERLMGPPDFLMAEYISGVNALLSELKMGPWE